DHPGALALLDALALGHGRHRAEWPEWTGGAERRAAIQADGGTPLRGDPHHGLHRALGHVRDAVRAAQRAVRSPGGGEELIEDAVLCLRILAVVVGGREASGLATAQAEREHG